MLNNDRNSEVTYRSIWPRALTIVLTTTLLAILLLVIFGRAKEWSETGRSLIDSLLYSFSIGVPSSFFLFRMFHRRHEFTAKHPRLAVLATVGVLLGMSVVGCLFTGLLLVMIGLVPSSRYWEEFSFSARFASVIALVVGLTLSFYENLRHKLELTALELRTRQMEEERARKLLAEATLSSLESRIHPHFLFNTLNSIAALIPKDPQLAENIVGKLASLLRFSLSTNQTSLVPLGQELKIVRDYLEIEKARFGARLRYAIDVPESFEAVNVPPLSVESLVENSVKHVIARRAQGGEIRITAASASGRIVLEIIDDGPGFSLETAPAGHGLENLMARLNLLFGPSAGLEVNCNQTHTTVRVSIPDVQHQLGEANDVRPSARVLGG